MPLSEPAPAPTPTAAGVHARDGASCSCEVKPRFLFSSNTTRELEVLQALLPYVLLQKDLVAGVGAGVICYQHAGCDIRHGPTPPDYGRKPGPPKPPYPELVPFSQAVDTKRMGGNLGALSLLDNPDGGAVGPGVFASAFTQPLREEGAPIGTL